MNKNAMALQSSSAKLSTYLWIVRKAKSVRNNWPKRHASQLTFLLAYFKIASPFGQYL